jgi:hypothetical protein
MNHFLLPDPYCANCTAGASLLENDRIAPNKVVREFKGLYVTPRPLPIGFSPASA